ncbi:MAG: DUF2442 domain-containing protein [Nodosilinea sp.]|jgi:hypothetical protein
MTTSETHGIITSKTEVSNISAHGIWLLCGDREYFLPYDQFPWFENAPVNHIFHLEEPHPGHLYWPNLDVDLSLEIIQNPERFPLTAKL